MSPTALAVAIPKSSIVRPLTENRKSLPAKLSVPSPQLTPIPNASDLVWIAGERGDRQPRRADGHEQRHRGREVVAVRDEEGHQRPAAEHRQDGHERFAGHKT